MNVTIKSILRASRWRRVLVWLMAAVFVLDPLASVCDAFGFASSADAEGAPERPLAGKYISVMGDSISTYTGWSDAYPITDPECTHRYGEAYYGTTDDFHCSDFLVTDTWWHKAATELGAQILMSNAGNSTGLFHASYPADADWDQYLKDMLMWKSRPYYLGKDGIDPDIIALYVGSNEVAKSSISEYGSVDDVDFDSLIKKCGNSWEYAVPATVAEAYCILMHKISVTYPDAEVYCFAVVPNSSKGIVNILNTRLEKAYAFNEMMRGVAEHYGAIVVELLDSFQLDPDGDGLVTAGDAAEFASCFLGDPHPNAKGFDVISETFTDTVLENSQYVAYVETEAGSVETVPLAAQESSSGGVTTITANATDYVTPNGMTVNFQGKKTLEVNGTTTENDQYTSYSAEKRYEAQGGYEETCGYAAPELEVELPLTDWDNPRSEDDDTVSEAAESGVTSTAITGDKKTSWDDGIYDYTTTTRSNTGSVRVQTTGVRVVQDRGGVVVENGMTHLNNTTVPSAASELMLDLSADQNDEVKEGYDYVYTGDSLYSRYASAFVWSKEPEEAQYKNQYTYTVDGTTYYTGNKLANFKRGGLIVPRLYLSPDNIPVSANADQWPARWAHVQHFLLRDKNGTPATVYCADRQTSAHEGYNYRIYNVEDANYYSYEAAQKIRAVARAGYWGNASGRGSLAYLKQELLDSGEFTQDEVDRLTDGMALIATQYAVWTNSNEAEGVTFVNSYTIDEGFDVDGIAEKETADLIHKLYWWLMSQDPAAVASEADTSNTVITEDNFLKNVSLKVTGKANHPNNNDADPDNDVYLVDVSFSLKVKILENNDDNIVMRIESEHGEPILCRLAGDVRENEVELKPVAGVYTVPGVLLEEGAMDVVFSLYGWQNLKEDVYLYLSETREAPEEPTSQTFVGIASGERAFYEALQLDFELEVNDGKECKERIWRTERTLPDVPPTGDNSNVVVWLMMLGGSVLLLSVMSRRRKAHV